MSFYQVFFSAVGVVTTSTLTLKFLRFVHLYTRQSSLKRYLHGSNAWALVTGASDGIGRGFAQELAHNGFNVVLHGRNSAKLEGVKSELLQEFPHMQYRTVIADASLSSYMQMDELVASLNDLHITVLINNVGGTLRIAPLEVTTPQEVDATMNMNARFPTQLAKALLPKLI